MKSLKITLSLAAVIIGRLALAQVVINEVMVKPQSNASATQFQTLKMCSQPTYGNEYIELYNGNPCTPVDVSCYLIGFNGNFSSTDHGTFRFPAGSVIPPLGFLSIGGPNSGATIILYNYCSTANLNTGNDRWYIPNGDGYVILWDANGTPVDAVYWTTSSGQASKWGTDSDIQLAPTLIASGTGCPNIISLQGPQNILITSPIVHYAGQAPSIGLVIHRTVDGGTTWVGNAAATINNCNGACVVASPFQISITGTQATCGANNGSATATPNPAGTYTYLWSANASNQTTQTATGLAAGAYFVTVTDTSGCAIVDTATIANSGGPTVTVSATAATCGNNNGTATVNASGGASPYSYLWNTTPQQTDFTATGLAPGNYSVTVTDNSSCTVVTTVTVPGSPAVTVSATPATCSSSNGTVSANPSGGTTPYSYLWNTTPMQTIQTATGLPAGTYTVTVTDANFCTATAAAIVTGGPSLTVIANPSTCSNSDGNATANPSGGATPYSYLWNNSLTSQTITGLVAGNYSVTVTDNNNCPVTGTATISNIGGPITATSVIPETCGLNNGTATVTLSGGTSPYYYLWNTSPSQTDSVATGLSAGIYSVTVTDDNNCTEITSATLVNINGPNTPAITQNNPSCGQSDGSITVSVTGGTSPYQYSSDGGTNFQSNNVFNNLSAGTYNIVVQDSNNCSSTTTVTLSNIGGVAVTAISVAASCNEANDGSATATQSGGISPYTYLWSNNQMSQTVTGLTAGNYSVTVTDSLGCSSTTMVNVGSAGGGTIADIVENDTTIFYGASIQLNTSGGATYLWSTGEITQNISVSPLTNTTYTVTVTDSAGCPDVDSINISIDDSQHTIAVSTIFTPNNDGINDFIKVHGYGIKEFRFLIYDRWGEKVKEITKLEDSWDGAFRGKSLNSAVFVYMLEVTFINGDTFNEQGNITLIR